MDGSRFDGITRVLAAETSRRRTLLGLASGLVAGVLGFSGIEEASAGCVKPGKKGCKGPKNGKCCTGARCQGGTKDKEGRCKCKGSFKQCGSSCVNTKNDSKNCGGCGKKCKGANTCKGGKCSSKLGCKVGANICDGPPVTSLDDPRVCDTDEVTFFCVCVTDVSGVARCSDFIGAVCADCSSNGDCPDGFVCIVGTGDNCRCDEQMGSNGNLCLPATCQGVSGSSGVEAAGGRQLPRTPLGR